MLGIYFGREMKGRTTIVNVWTQKSGTVWEFREECALPVRFVSTRAVVKLRAIIAGGVEMCSALQRVLGRPREIRFTDTTTMAGGYGRGEGIFIRRIQAAALKTLLIYKKIGTR